MRWLRKDPRTAVLEPVLSAGTGAEIPKIHPSRRMNDRRSRAEEFFQFPAESSYVIYRWFFFGCCGMPRPVENDPTALAQSKGWKSTDVAVHDYWDNAGSIGTATVQMVFEGYADNQEIASSDCQMTGDPFRRSPDTESIRVEWAG